MKQLYTLIIICFTLSVFAQEKIEVVLAEKEMSQGNQTSFMVKIPEASAKHVEKSWKKYINERSVYPKKSVKAEKIGNEFVITGLINEELETHQIDVFAILTPEADGVWLSSFFRYSDSIFVSEKSVSADIIQTVNNFIRNFGVETYKQVVEEQVEEQEDIQSKNENELEKLKKENKALHKSIGKDEAEIDEFEYDLKVATADLERIEGVIVEIKTSLDLAVRNSVEYEEIKDRLKSKEKERKKVQNKQKSLKGKIQRNETDIRDAQADIVTNEKDQENQQEKIEKQKNIVETYRTKLANIK